MKKKTVAVLFGGRSVEHEISVITGLQLIKAMDVVSYRPLPVYVAPDGRWFSGEALLERNFYKQLPGSLCLVDEVTLLPVPGVGGLTVLCGRGPDGRSAQKPGREVIPVDVFFVAFHGTYGEDGCVQGLLEMAAVAYTGCGVLSSALGMSKYHCKKLVESHGVPVLPAAVINKEQIQADLGANLAEVRKGILALSALDKFPLFVKPCNLGSSIGVAKVRDSAELDAALIQALKYDTAAMVEPCLDNKLEINVSVLDDVEPHASVVEIPVSSSGDELTYEDKYMRGGASKKTGNVSQGMAGLTRIIDPGDLDPRIKAEARELAVRSFKALGCAGVARIDFMLDLSEGKLYFNEINTLPGSLAFYLWMNSKPPVFYTDMLTRIIERGESRQQARQGLLSEIGFKALFK